MKSLESLRSLFLYLQLLPVSSSFSSSYCRLVIEFSKDSSCARFSPLLRTRRESAEKAPTSAAYLNRSQTWRIIYQNKGTFSLHSNLAVILRFQHACTKELRPILERRPWYDTWTPSKIAYRNFKNWNLTD